MHARYAGQLLGDNFVRAMLGGHPAQGDRRREAHKAIAAQPGDGKELLDAVQHAQRRVNFAFFAPRRAAKHHRYRHHLYVQIRVITVEIQVVMEQLNGIFFWRVPAKNTRAAMDKDVARQQRAVDLQRLQRVGQLMCQTLSTQSQ